MDFEIWLVFAIAYLVTTLSPGPNVLLVMKNSLKHGWQSAFLTIVGNLLCQLMIVIMVAFGIGTIIEQSPPVFMVLKVVGAGYLIFTGVKQIRAIKTNPHHLKAKEGSTPGEHGSDFVILRDAFFVSASNPKTIIFLSAFLPQFLSPDKPLTLQFTVMFLTISIIVTAVHSFYAFSVSRLKTRFTNSGFRKPLSAVSGTLFISLGFGVLFSDR